MELIRKLLFYFEERDTSSCVAIPQVEAYDAKVIEYHLLLMHDANLLRCEPIRSRTSDRVIKVIPFELTWEGHEFLEKVRSDKVWKKIKRAIISKGGSLAFSVINHVATNYALQTITKA